MTAGPQATGELAPVPELPEAAPKPRRGWGRYATYLTGAVVLLIAWDLLSTHVVNPHLLPPPWRVVLTAIPMIASGELWANGLASLSRVAVGFVTGSAAGIVLGVLMGRVRVINDFCDPIVQPLRFLSPTAMIPIAIIWFGIGEGSKYFLIFYGTFFVVLIDTIAGVVATPTTRVRASQCLGATQFQVFRLVVVPSAIPYIISGMRIALASAFMAIIPAELLAAQSGLGYLLEQAGMQVQTDRIFVVLAVISFLGFAADAVFRLATTQLLRRFSQQMP